MEVDYVINLNFYLISLIKSEHGSRLRYKSELWFNFID